MYVYHSVFHPIYIYDEDAYELRKVTLVCHAQLFWRANNISCFHSKRMILPVYVNSRTGNEGKQVENGPFAAYQKYYSMQFSLGTSYTRRISYIS